MKKTIRIIAFLLLVAVAAYILVKSYKKPGYQIVKISGAESYANLSNSGLNLIVSNNMDSISALPLFDEELLYLGIDEELLFYQYKKSDGVNLVFSWDGFRLFLNDEVIFARIDEDPMTLEWLDSVVDKGEPSLRSIGIEDSLPQPYQDRLEDLGEIMPELGLIIGDLAWKDYLFKVFSPNFLAVEGYSSADTNKLFLDDMQNLEVLFIDAEYIDFNDFPSLKKLKYLLLTSLEMEYLPQSLELPGQLISLTLFEPDIKDLDMIKNLELLDQLSMVDLDSFAFGDKISSLKSLRSLSLTNCQNIRDIEKLGEINSLLRASYPSDIDQESFIKSIVKHKNLEILELPACEEIQSLEVLKELPKLACLTMTDPSVSIESLFDLTNLDYLAYTIEEDDSASLQNLNSKLPNTLIVPVDGLCLGTGWLLLFIPLLFLLGIGIAIKRKSLR